MSASIRPATAEDAVTFLELVDALAAYERLPPPDDAARQRLLADAFGSAPRVAVLLAEARGRAQGYALYFETYSSFLARPTLYLEDLFVTPGARGQGLGRALFRAVAREAVSRNCARMEWNVLRWNAPAIRFYEGLGAAGLAEWQMFRLDGAHLERAGAA